MSDLGQKFNNLEEVINTLKNEMIVFNKKYGSNGKIKGLSPRGEIFEKLTYNAFLNHFAEENVQWDSASHCSGKDITVKKENVDFHFSLKTGAISDFKSKAQEVSFSSYRTTRFKTLEEKLNYIDSEGNLFNYYLIYFRNDQEHMICVIPSSLVKAKNLEWTKTTSKTGNVNYLGKGNHIEMKIVSTMSDQLWITINKEFLNHPDIVKVDISGFNSTLIAA